MAENNNKQIDGVEKVLFSDRERAELWVAKNWKKSAIVMVIIAVAGVVGYTIAQHLEEKAKACENALIDAKADALADAISKNSGAKGAAFARMRLASDLVSKKDFKGAVAQYKAVVADPECDAQLKLSASVAIAQAYEAAGDAKQALASYLLVEKNSTASVAVRINAACAAARLMIDAKAYKDAELLLKRYADIEKKSNQPPMAQPMLISLLNGEFKAAAPAKKAVKAVKKAAPAKKAVKAAK